MKFMGFMFGIILATSGFSSEKDNQMKENFEKTQRQMIENAQLKLEKLINESIGAQMTERLDKIINRADIRHTSTPPANIQASLD